MSGKKSKKIQTDHRIIYINGFFDEDLSQDTMQTLLDLEADNPTKDILMFIDSYGGYYDSFIAIHDAIRLCRCDVATICIGKAMSCGQLLLISGKKNKRFITPNSRVMMHSVSAGHFGNVAELDNEIEETKRNQKVIESMIIDYTKIKKSELKELMLKDAYLTADTCKKLGIVDHIIDSPKSLYSRVNL